MPSRCLSQPDNVIWILEKLLVTREPLALHNARDGFRPKFELPGRC